MATGGWQGVKPRLKGVRIASGRRSKYGAVKVTIDGVTFASKAEGRRYVELKALWDAGKIRGQLEIQPSYPLTVAGVTVGKYIADFRYYRDDGELMVEDVKGMKTPVYRLKKKLVEAIYGISIREV